MIRTIITLAMLLAFAQDAAAADAPSRAPRLKESVTVTSEIVRIGDLVENAGAAASIPVFRAPDLGQTGSVAVARIAAALRLHDVFGVDTGGLTEVVVTHLSRTITGKEITHRIARAVAGQFGFGPADNLAIVLDRPARLVHVEASATGELAIARLHVEPRTGRFDVIFELPGSTVARRLPLRVTGTVTDTVAAAALTRSINSGEIIKAADIAIERRPKAEVGNYAIGIDQAVGLAARYPLRGGQVLRPADLTKPVVVQRNEAVTIVYEVPGILLTVRGKALEAGAVGDAVGVLNTQSKRTIQATVSGPGRVTIAATMPVVASALPAAAQHPARHHTE
jgi:flagella basal body P-ring formation protein FlgA